MFDATAPFNNVASPLDSRMAMCADFQTSHELTTSYAPFRGAFVSNPELDGIFAELDLMKGVLPAKFDRQEKFYPGTVITPDDRPLLVMKQFNDLVAPMYKWPPTVRLLSCVNHKEHYERPHPHNLSGVVTMSTDEPMLIQRPDGSFYKVPERMATVMNDNRKDSGGAIIHCTPPKASQTRLTMVAYGY